MPDGKKADIIWRITHQRQIRTDAAGTSIWHMKTWTPPDGYDGSVGKEWRLVRQTIASAVDNGGDDPVRDEMPSQRRIPAQQRLSILLDCLGADLFGTARMSCHEDMDLGEIGLSMGVGTGARCGAAAARECRVVLRRAIEVYRAIAVAEQRDTGTPASWWADIGSVATIAKKKGKSPVRAAKTTETGGQAANDNTHRRQKAA